jgi:hypothetical protein
MFKDIAAIRLELWRQRSADPAYGTLDALFGAIQDALEDLEVRVHELQRPVDPTEVVRNAELILSDPTPLQVWGSQLDSAQGAIPSRSSDVSRR